ncbi:GDSL-type esterase/lipase family protein [Actinomyces trachealis]|uniref:GDSL-type esterase/lipase family protein n=1 Tax=Actinomyces trachealis TaxID=2763540 RepID=UPI0018928EE7|nr:GDSL-type esterase/lipase family protein [Actinomyces trachealis]
MRPLNLVFVGDELTSAYGDARALGWVGRVMAHTRLDPVYPPIMWASLPVFGETTAQLADRWSAEVGRRLITGMDNRAVVGIGAADLEAGTSTARSRLNLANVLDGARTEHLDCFVVGPPPLPRYDQTEVERLSDAVAEVCSRRAVPFVDTFHPLLGHEQWKTDMAATGGMRPGQAGYGLLTWLVLHRGWYEWLGVPAQT